MKEVNHHVKTKDGSSTIKNDVTGDLYHSIHGAETESHYVFIEKGFNHCLNNSTDLSILEVGLGTGLNALLTFIEAERMKLNKLKYTSIEPYPISQNLISTLIFKCLEIDKAKEIFNKIHQDYWGKMYLINEFIEFIKLRIRLHELTSSEKYDLIYYDAFGPTYQPEMWKKDLIKGIISKLKPRGIFVTYCAQGELRRNLQSFGLQVERLQGPPGKREMIRAIKC